MSNISNTSWDFIFVLIALLLMFHPHITFLYFQILIHLETQSQSDQISNGLDFCLQPWLICAERMRPHEQKPSDKHYSDGSWVSFLHTLNFTSSSPCVCSHQRELYVFFSVFGAFLRQHYGLDVHATKRKRNRLYSSWYSEEDLH